MTLLIQFLSIFGKFLYIYGSSSSNMIERQTWLDPVGEPSRKSRWPAPRMRRCESKWSDNFESASLFMVDEKHFSGGEGDGRRVVTWMKAPSLIKTANLGGLAISFFADSSLLEDILFHHNLLHPIFTYLKLQSWSDFTGTIRGN